MSAFDDDDDAGVSVFCVAATSHARSFSSCVSQLDEFRLSLGFFGSTLSLLELGEDACLFLIRMRNMNVSSLVVLCATLTWTGFKLYDVLKKTNTKHNPSPAGQGKNPEPIMSFVNNSNVSMALIEKVQSSIRPSHNFVRVLMTHCSQELVNRVEQALNKEPFNRSSEVAHDFQFGHGLSVHQTKTETYWTRETDVVQIPFRVAIGKKNTNIIHAIPRIRIILSRRERVSAPDDPLLKMPVVQTARFRVTRAWENDRGYKYEIVRCTPMCEIHEMEEACEHPSRQLFSVVVSGHTTTVHDAFEFACVNSLNLTQGLYSSKLSVRLEP